MLRRLVVAVFFTGSIIQAPCAAVASTPPTADNKPQFPAFAIREFSPGHFKPNFTISLVVIPRDQEKAVLTHLAQRANPGEPLMVIDHHSGWGISNIGRKISSNPNVHVVHLPDMSEFDLSGDSAFQCLPVIKHARYPASTAGDATEGVAVSILGTGGFAGSFYLKGGLHPTLKAAALSLVMQTLNNLGLIQDGLDWAQRHGNEKAGTFGKWGAQFGLGFALNYVSSGIFAKIAGVIKNPWSLAGVWKISDMAISGLAANTSWDMAIVKARESHRFNEETLKRVNYGKQLINTALGALTFIPGLTGVGLIGSKVFAVIGASALLYPDPAFKLAELIGAGVDNAYQAVAHPVGQIYDWATHTTGTPAKEATLGAR
ncbi:MAG: hypothetical protein C5B49_11810 [Bdellovibrio sp.]|nr:MAG: hypothetical protein C5B49_11810 [Bdellovibrio sp.]